MNNNILHCETQGKLRMLSNSQSSSFIVPVVDGLDDTDELMFSCELDFTPSSFQGHVMGVSPGQRRYSGANNRPDNPLAKTLAMHDKYRDGYYPDSPIRGPTPTLRGSYSPTPNSLCLQFSEMTQTSHQSPPTLIGGNNHQTTQASSLSSFNSAPNLLRVANNAPQKARSVSPHCDFNIRPCPEFKRMTIPDLDQTQVKSLIHRKLQHLQPNTSSSLSKIGGPTSGQPFNTNLFPISNFASVRPVNSVFDVSNRMNH